MIERFVIEVDRGDIPRPQVESIVREIVKEDGGQLYHDPSERGVYHVALSTAAEAYAAGAAGAAGAYTVRLFVRTTRTVADKIVTALREKGAKAEWRESDGYL